MNNLAVALREARVLLAEDDDELRSLIAGKLRQDGYFVEEVKNGYQLLISLSWPDAPHDLIISDVNLPGLSALEVVAALRSPYQRGRRRTPVVLITAFGDSDTHREAQRLQ